MGSWRGVAWIVMKLSPSDPDVGRGSVEVPARSLQVQCMDGLGDGPASVLGLGPNPTSASGLWVLTEIGPLEDKGEEETGSEVGVLCGSG